MLVVFLKAVTCLTIVVADVGHKMDSSHNAFDPILSSFFFFSMFPLSQACTGIDNIAEAITLLELNNWDLVVSLLSLSFGHCPSDRLAQSTKFRVLLTSSHSLCHIISSFTLYMSLIRQCLDTSAGVALREDVS